MTKLEIEAIKKLPDAYVVDGTGVCLIGSKNEFMRQCVAAISPNLVPMVFWEDKKEWEEIKFQ